MERYTLNLDEEELVNFFKKYSIQELDTFKTIFNYVYDYDITSEKAIIEDVYKELEIEGWNEYCVPVKTFNYRASDLTKKNKYLTDKELEFLYNLADDALLCLESINCDDVQIIKEEIDIITESAHEELEARSQMKGKSIILDNNKKEV